MEPLENEKLVEALKTLHRLIVAMPDEKSIMMVATCRGYTDIVTPVLKQIGVSTIQEVWKL